MASRLRVLKERRWTLPRKPRELSFEVYQDREHPQCFRRSNAYEKDSRAALGYRVGKGNNSFPNIVSIRISWFSFNEIILLVTERRVMRMKSPF